VPQHGALCTRYPKALSGRTQPCNTDCNSNVNGGRKAGEEERHNATFQSSSLNTDTQKIPRRHLQGPEHLPAEKEEKNHFFKNCILKTSTQRRVPINFT